MLKLIPKNERRQFGRRQSSLSGAVHLSDGTSRPCTIRNFSEAGALIALADGADLPKQFVLTIERTAMRVPCDVRHRNGVNWGVQFRATARGGDTIEDSRPHHLAYGQLLALARADQEAAEFDARFGHAFGPASSTEQRAKVRA